MNANDVAKLLEREWQNIRQQLGEGWGEFHRAYRDIIATLPEEPTRSDLERVADEICQLMSRYDYTLGLLQGWQGGLSERLLPSAGETLSEKEQIRQVCNRFKHLAEQDEARQEQGQSSEKPERGK
ncbi:MAG: hypothetical protein ACK40X_08700 [Armatimonadota bacterium]